MADSTGEVGILVVDDERAVRDVVATALEQSGYAVFKASGSVDALSATPSGDRPVKLLLTDIQMPGMDGIELAQEWTKSHPNTRILFMTGYSHDAAVSGAPVLYKPFTIAQLREAVKRALGDYDASRDRAAQDS